MSARRLVAGVDSSTQSCKIVVCDADTGEVVRHAQSAHPESTEVDPQHWWDAYVDARSDGLLNGVQAIAVGGQQHGMVLLDQHDAVVRDALLWNDTRSARAAADLVAERGGSQAWADEIGVVPLAAITVAKLRWVAENEPDLMATARTIVLPHDWMTGHIISEVGTRDGWTTDRGDASGTGYWSARQERYHPEVLELACGSELEVPRVLSPHEAAGQGPDGIIVGPGTGDNAAAALSLGIAEGDVVVSLGTSGTVFARADRAATDASGQVAGFADATGAYLPLVCTLNAARVLIATAQILSVELDQLDALASRAPVGAGGLTLLPYLDGERTPDLPQATGTLSGMTRANATPAHHARAAVEGMLLNLVGGLDALRAQGVAPRRLILIGGASSSVAVQQSAAVLFGLDVVVPAPGEYVGIGAARQAAWVLDGGEQPPQWNVPLQPVAAPEQVDESAVDQVRQQYRALLNRLHPGH